MGEYLEIVFFQAVDDQVGQEQVLEDAAGEGNRVAAGAFTAEDAAGDNQVRQEQVELVSEFIGRFTVQASERQVQKERGGRKAEQRVVAGVGAEKEGRCVERSSVRESLRVTFRRELEDHGGLAFTGGLPAEAENGGRRVEDTTGRGRRHTVDVAFDLGFQERQLCRVTEPEASSQVFERGSGQTVREGFTLVQGLL